MFKRFTASLVAVILTVGLITANAGGIDAKRKCNPAHPCATPVPTATVGPTATPTTKPTATPTAKPTPTATPVVTPSPTPTATATVIPTATPTSTPALKSVTVNSVPAILSNLADNSIDEIVVVNGTYVISGAANQAPNSLWIDSRFTARTRPVTVRAQTIGGVTFDCGGGYCGGISFNGGSHDQTWDGFNFANGVTSSTGVIVFGGYAGLTGSYGITLRNFTLQKTLHRVNSGTTDHGVYFSYAVGGAHDILLDNLTEDASDPMGLATEIHMDHGYASDAPNIPAWNVTVRNMRFLGNHSFNGQQAVILWQPPIHDWLFDGGTITNSGSIAVRFESIGAQRITFQNMTSTGSVQGGFYSSEGANPPGVTFINDSFN